MKNWKVTITDSDKTTTTYITRDVPDVFMKDGFVNIHLDGTVRMIIALPALISIEIDPYEEGDEEIQEECQCEKRQEVTK